MDEDFPAYVISVAAQLSGLHPQTLRQYDRMGLVSPHRSGRYRLYSLRDIRRLEKVQQLTADGLNLEGIRRVLELEEEAAQLRARLEQYESEERSRALVVWSPRKRA